MKKRLSKKDMTIITLFKMSDGKKKMVHYEDLLVQTFRSFKKDFQLKRYPDYPDSDVFRYIVYFQLKPAGLIRIAQKQIMITDLGIKESNKLLDNNVQNLEQNYARVTNEVMRLFSLAGYKMFLKNQLDKIIDQDFYDFFKSSVRTKPLELLGNISQVSDTIKEYKKTNKKVGSQLVKYSEYLKKQFMHIYEGVKHAGNS